MRRTANGRRVCALADYTVERTSKGWYFGRTSRFGDMHAMKGLYSSERSVALMIARELLKEIVKRDTQTKLPGWPGSFFCAAKVVLWVNMPRVIHRPNTVSIRNEHIIHTCKPARCVTYGHSSCSGSSSSSRHFSRCLLRILHRCRKERPDFLRTFLLPARKMP